MESHEKETKRKGHVSKAHKKTDFF
jgi:hypothetical protein